MGEIPEAIAHEQAAIDAYHELGDERLEAASRVYLATILEIGGRYVEAEREARRATLLLATVPPLAPIAISKLADLLRLQGHVDEAISTAEEAARALERAGRVEGDGSMVHLALAEALACANRMAEARVALSMARAELDRQAGKIPDPAWRARFLGSIPHHARILALSAQWS